MTETAVPLTKNQVPLAGAVLARAFHEDPLWLWILPEAAKRTALLPAFFAATAGYGVEHGRVDSTPAIDGAAIWIPPARAPAAPDGPEAAEYGPVNDGFDTAAAAQFTAMTGYYQALRSRLVPEPHWYLACLGVEPSRQRSGVGSALLRPVLVLTDNGGCSCYLETENERNLSFYRSQGFELLEAGRLPEGGPACWTMKRSAGTRK